AADGLAIVPADETEVVTGSELSVLPLRPLSEIEAGLAAPPGASAEDDAAEAERRRGRGRHRGPS
ncbi:MAG TPA: hypothetical protein VK045_09590, partial [Ornithinicoccus sp.]|nr:hypothetical protein [Ornithinicoccus sp.]